jgi:hypothetical protein
MVALCGHDRTRGEVQDAADGGAREQKEAPTDAIDEAEDSASGNDEDGVLYNGRGESSVSRLSTVLALNIQQGAACKFEDVAGMRKYAPVRPC